MFYMKYKGKKLEIHEDNVFAICPGCGKEHSIDLAAVLASGEADLYSTAVYCESCTRKRDVYRKQLEPYRAEITAIAQRHDTSEDSVRQIVFSALEYGLDLETALIGTRLALSQSDGKSEYFTLPEAARVLGTDEQTALQELKRAGISPARITTLPGFEWLLGQ